MASQRRLFFLAAGLLVAGDTVFWTMLAAFQSGTGVAVWDGPVHDGLVAFRNPMATAVLSGVSTVTSPLWMTVVGLVFAVAWAFWKRELWRPGLLLGAMAATFVLSTLIKQAVDRGRPPAADFLLGPDDALSFPSGHTFGAGVFLLVLTYLFVGGRGSRSTAVVAYAAAAAGTALVALSRLYLGYHWLTDVTASLGLAVAVTGLVILADGLGSAWNPGRRQDAPSSRP
jgi:undecaprenyl-diphosphatase